MTDQVNEAVAWMFEQEEYGEWVTRLSLSREAREGDGKRNLRPLYTHPSRGVVDEAMVERAHFAFISYDGDVRNSLRAALQAAALPAVPDDRISVSRSMAGMAATIATEWLGLFAETPGLEKYERYTYGPQVEMLRDDLIAMLAATPAHDQPEGSDND